MSPGPDPSTPSLSTSCVAAPVGVDATIGNFPWGILSFVLDIVQGVVTMKELLIAIGIAAALVLFLPHVPMVSPHDAGLTVMFRRGALSLRVGPFGRVHMGVISANSRGGLRQDRAQGGQCEIVINGQRPRAVHIPSDSELAEMGHKFDDATRLLCDNLANAGYGFHISHN